MTTTTKRKRMEAAKAAFDEQIVKMKQDEEARGLWCTCGHSTYDHNCGYTCQSVACKCLVFTPKMVEPQPAITLSNFRVEYHAPKLEDGKVLYDGYCAVLADDASLDGATVRVFDVPDADESQRAVAQWTCEAINQHEQYAKLLDAAKLLLAMNNCNYDRDQMRRSGGFDGLLEVVEQLQPDWHHRVKATTATSK